MWDLSNISPFTHKTMHASLGYKHTMDEGKRGQFHVERLRYCDLFGYFLFCIQKSEEV